MNVGKSVRKALDEWDMGDVEGAMLHACNAVDGTAKKVHPKRAVKERFVGLIRDNYDIFGPMGVPGVDLVATQFPVHNNGKLWPMDMAEVIYYKHRCAHGHGDELDESFELLPYDPQPIAVTSFSVERGSIQLSARVVFGLLAVAVSDSLNVSQSIPESYYLFFEHTRFDIHEWWGRRVEFRKAFEGGTLPPLVKLDFGEWMDDVEP